MHPSRGGAANEGGHLNGFAGQGKDGFAAGALAPARRDYDAGFIPTMTALGVPHLASAPVWLFLQIMTIGRAGGAGAAAGGTGVFWAGVGEHALTPAKPMARIETAITRYRDMVAPPTRELTPIATGAPDASRRR